MSAEDALPWVWFGVVLLSVYVLAALISSGRMLASGKWVSAWRASVQLMGWLPIAAAALLVGAIVFFAPLQSSWEVPQLGPMRAAATVIPVIVACHLAFAFSPADEFALETLLVSPRPLVWVLCERAALTILPYAGLALVANWVVVVRFPDITTAFWLHWIAPLLFLSAVSVMVTLASRQAAFGMTLTIVVWTGLAFMGDGMLLRWPHLWPLHVYLQPEQAISADTFTLHQLWLVLVAFAIFVRTGRQLKHSEKLLSALRT